MTENFQSSNEELKKYCEELKKDVQLNKNVLFIHCPLFSIDTFERSVAKNRGYYSCNPVGLQYLSSSLKGRGLNIEIFDLNYEILKKSNSDDSFNPFDWLDIVDEHIGGKDYSVIGFSNLYIANIPYFVKIKKYLEERGKHIIITGGPNATYNTKEFLKKGLCHFVCERESENKINFLFDNLYENKGCKPTPGILFKPNEEIIETSGEKDIVELEGNLIDSYDLIPIEDYCKTGSTSPYSRMVGKDVPFALILFNRGCRGNCSFCDVRDFTGGYNRTRKIEDFLDEMEYLNKKRGIKFFEIIDDDFTMNKEKTLEVLRGIQERKLDIKWAANTGMIGSSLGEELMKEIKDSGCVGFHIGVESGNSDSLKKIGKLGTRESFLEFSKIAQKYPEMFIMENYILGFPHEDFGKMKESFDFSFELNLDWGHFNLYQEYTKKEEALKENDKVTDFVPTKDFFKGRLETGDKIFKGPEVFNIPEQTMPSKEQLKEIWFTFNFVRNFIHNKNLQPEGNIKKFIDWIKIIQERYPAHPYITLFLGLAYCLQEDTYNADKFFDLTRENLKDGYWFGVMDRFGLAKIDFPTTSEEAFKFIGDLKEKYIQNGR